MSYAGGSAGGLQGWATPARQMSMPPVVLPVQRGTLPAVPWNGGRFRRHLNGVTVDILGAPLGSSLVLVYDTTTRLLEAALTSDAAGTYDLPLYREGTTWFLYTNKAGTPEVFGASSNQLVPV